ncbi:hypothetical protein OAG68_02755, partial [bacterium]|nr:hypothetical protein [bacterium]
ADRSAKDEEEFWWFSLVDGHFENNGWSYPDGPGEWSWVERPGDEYQQTIKCELEISLLNEGSPIYVNVMAPAISDSEKHRQRARTSVPRISLIHANRNREHANLSPWTARPPRPNCQDTRTLDDVRVFDRDTIRMDLSKLRIRGGWIPGKYHVSLRLQNFHKPDSQSWSSEISAPFQFQIC